MALLQTAPPAAGDVRDKAHQILSQGAFAHHESVVQRIVDWIDDRLSSLSFGSSGGPGIIGDLVGLLVVAGVVVLLVLIVRSLLGWRRPAKSKPEVTVDSATRRTEDEWRREAERLEAAGQWRDAMRARYSELTRALVDAGLLHDIPGSTTGDHRAQLAQAAPNAGAPFARLTALFEDTWYGGRAADAKDNATFRQLADRVRDIATSKAQPDPRDEDAVLVDA